jgi:predicted DCC family thiol-disulfide oxidoreductase YuxK
MTASTPPDSFVTANWLLYDGDCPFCSSYVSYVRLRDAVGPITLADARRCPTLVAESRALGYDIDVGMVLKLDGRYYFGGDCIHALSLLTTPSGTFNRMNRALFRSRRVARLAYPILRAGRNIALVVLGRRRIGATPAAVSNGATKS